MRVSQIGLLLAFAGCASSTGPSAPAPTTTDWHECTRASVNARRSCAVSPIPEVCVGDGCQEQVNNEAWTCYRVVWRALVDGTDGARLGPSFALYAERNTRPLPDDRDEIDAWMSDGERRFIDRTCRAELSDLPFEACASELRFAVQVPWCGGFGAGP